MQKKQQNQIIIDRLCLEGDWDWRNISLGSGTRWFVLSQTPPREHIWTFRDDGVMTSIKDGTRSYVTRYRFDPVRSLLALKGYMLDRDGNRELNVNEYYRVEFAGEDVLYLYDLVGVDDDEEPSLRLMFRKVGSEEPAGK